MCSNVIITDTETLAVFSLIEMCRVKTMRQACSHVHLHVTYLNPE